MEDGMRNIECNGSVRFGSGGRRLTNGGKSRFFSKKN